MQKQNNLVGKPILQVFAGSVLILLTVFSLLFAKKISEEYKIIHDAFLDTNREVRIAACETAGAIAEKEFIADLNAALNDSADLVKIKAALALHKLGDNSGIAEIRKILVNSAKVSETPTPLERARAIAKGTTRAEAARVLGDIKDSGSSAILRKLTDDDDGRVADACLVALAKLGDLTIKDKFISALESTKQEVRAKASEALGEIADPITMPVLRKRLKDWNRESKNAAVIALGKLKDKESEPVIKELLWDKDDIVREKAAVALGNIGQKESLEALKKAMEDANGIVRIAAAEALYKLGDDFGKEFLIRVLKSEDKDAKIKALSVLSNYATEKDVKEIGKMIKDPDKSVALYAARTVIMASKRK